MMNTPTIEAAIADAKQETPDMPLGVHLVLSYGRPLSPPTSVKTLIDDAGKFHSAGSLTAKADSIDPEEIEREWTNQIQRLDTLGVTVDHLDSHHHAAYVHPAFTEVQLRLAARFGLSVRRPPPPPESHPLVIGMIDRRQDVWAPAVFNGELMLGSSPEKFLGLLDRCARDQATEFMVHPGIVDDELLAVSTYATPRGPEFATLSDASVISALRQPDIFMTTFIRAAHDATLPSRSNAPSATGLQP
jgi:chitin disaccharide deacetylase